MKEQPWHKLLLESLGDVADTGAQCRSWIEGTGPDLPSPSELVCQIFDDSGLDVLLEAGPVFSDDADRILREMSSLVSTIDLEQSPESLTNDSDWDNFCRLAGQALFSVKRALAIRGTDGE